MKSINLIIGCILLMMIISFSSCKKEGMGGKARISGHVMHHEDAIPNAIVYIKYGVTELPGTSPSDYDDQIMASASDAHYEFEDLQKGDYYLYGVGYDSTCMCDVIGGVPVMIKEKAEALETNIPVTEK